MLSTPEPLIVAPGGCQEARRLVWRELESVIAGFLRTRAFLPICSATLLLHGEGVEKRGGREERW